MMMMDRERGSRARWTVPRRLAAAAAAPTEPLESPRPMMCPPEEEEAGALLLAPSSHLLMPASIDPVTPWERVRYVVGSALAIGGVAELIGFGTLGLLLGVAGGVAGYVFSEDLHQFFLAHLPVPPSARGTGARRLHWWLTGQVDPPVGDPHHREDDPDEEREDLDEDQDRDAAHRVAASCPQQPSQRSPDPQETASAPAPTRRLRRGATQADALPPDAVQLAPDLALPIDEIAGRAIFIAGIRRSGKTTLGVRIIEELGGHYLPIFWPDLEGDGLSMVEILPRGKIAGHPERFSPQYEYACAFEPVTLQNAFLLGFTILEEGWQVILDMASYPTVEEACQVIVQVIRGLFAWADAHPSRRVPCHIGLDEAQRFLPERLADSIIADKPTLEALLKASMDILAVGGKRGLAPLILTQRMAQVNKKIMAQSEIFFLLRQTMDNDLARCMEYVRRSTATEQEISRFAQGEGIYIGPDGEQFVTRFFKRHSSGVRSHTPRAEAARRYAGLPMRPLGASVPTTGAAPSRQPTVLVPALEDLQPCATEPPAAATVAPPQPLPSAPRLALELQKALDAWVPGMSYRDLGRAIGCGKDKAGELIEELRQRGLIPSKDQELALLHEAVDASEERA